MTSVGVRPKIQIVCRWLDTETRRSSTSYDGSTLALGTAVMTKFPKGRRNQQERAARRRFVTGLILLLLAIAAAIYFGAARKLPAFEPVPSSAAVVPASFQAEATLRIWS
jgi:hypothetical protein